MKPSASTRTVLLPLVALVALAVSGASCMRDARADEYIARADTALAQRRYPDVIQQSQRALVADRHDGRAAALLGRAHLALANFAQAYEYLLQARPSTRSSDSLRLELATYYMIESRPDDAREQAREVARSDSTNLPARIVLALTATTSGQILSGIRALESTRTTGASETQRRIALGILCLRTGDTAAANRQLREAVAGDPRSPEAHAALASLFDASGNRASAESERSAATLDLGISPSRRLEMAEYFARLGQHAEAERWLAGIAANDSVGWTARRLLAELQLADHDRAALATASAIVARDSSDADALVQRGRARLAVRDAAGAEADFTRALRVAPTLAPARYQLGMARLAELDSARVSRGSRDSITVAAAAEFDAATKLVPDYADAVFARAELDLRAGRARRSIESMDRYVRSNPGSIRGHELLAAVLAASGRASEATETFDELIAIDPDRAESHYEFGVALQTSGNKAQAVEQFEAALALAPAYADPMTQVVLMDLADARSGEAIDRIDRQLQRAPASAPLYDLLGLVHAARQELSSAETAYRRAIQLDPSLVDARVRLSELYDATGRYEIAALQADSIRRWDPRNLRALMAAGVARQQLHDTVGARQAYEAALAIDPRFSGAANNLALLLADEPGGLDRAYRLASLASSNAPDDPHVADTYGWLLYKRADYAQAMSVLERAAARLPDSPVVLFHFGMTAQKLGDTLRARAALTKAVAAPADFDGKEDARRALAQLR